MKLTYLSLGHRDCGEAYPTPVMWLRNSKNGAIYFRNNLTGVVAPHSNDAEEVKDVRILFKGE